ncbi:MAG: AAA family ATPase [Coleofasciculus sp. C2-GNP5-27]
MLKMLILKNWKIFRYAALPIDPLTVLIGANASGKSNVIEALEFLKRTVSGKELSEFAIPKRSTVAQKLDLCKSSPNTSDKTCQSSYPSSFT